MNVEPPASFLHTSMCRLILDDAMVMRASPVPRPTSWCEKRIDHLFTDGIWDTRSVSRLGTT